MKYYEIIKEGISICMDTDVDYFHHFKMGDMICISNYYNPTLEYIVNDNTKWCIKLKFSYFNKNWSSNNHQKWTIPECAYQGYFKEIEEGAVLSRIREFKLKEILN